MGRCDMLPVSGCDGRKAEGGSGANGRVPAVGEHLGNGPSHAGRAVQAMSGVQAACIRARLLGQGMLTCTEEFEASANYHGFSRASLRDENNRHADRTGKRQRFLVSLVDSRSRQVDGGHGMRASLREPDIRARACQRRSCIVRSERASQHDACRSIENRATVAQRSVSQVGWFSKWGDRSLAMAPNVCWLVTRTRTLLRGQLVASVTRSSSSVQHTTTHTASNTSRRRSESTPNPQNFLPKGSQMNSAAWVRFLALTGAAFVIAPIAFTSPFQSACPVPLPGDPPIYCCCKPASITPGTPPTASCGASQCDGDENGNCSEVNNLYPTQQAYSQGDCVEVNYVATNCPTRRPYFGEALYYKCKKHLCEFGGFNCGWEVDSNTPSTSVWQCGAGYTACH